MKRSTIVGGIAVAGIVALGIAVYASPYRAVNALREAAEAGDRERLVTFVDFPALRESLKAELNATVIAPMLDKAQGKPYSGLGTVLAGAMLGPMVDAMVTPEGVAEMVRRGRPRPATGDTAATAAEGSSPGAVTGTIPLPQMGSPAGGGATSATPATQPSAAEPRATQPPSGESRATQPPAAEGPATRPQPTMGYNGVNRFLVTFPVAGAGQHDNAFGLVFLRDGLFGWKLSQVRFPPRS